jgi:hypothetical protein
MANTTIHQFKLDGEDQPYCWVLMTGEIVTEHWTTPETPELRKNLQAQIFHLVHRLTMENITIKRAQGNGPQNTPLSNVSGEFN